MTKMDEMNKAFVDAIKLDGRHEVDSTSDEAQEIWVVQCGVRGLDAETHVNRRYTYDDAVGVLEFTLKDNPHLWGCVTKARTNGEDFMYFARWLLRKIGLIQS